jgi:hypothetical protein
LNCVLANSAACYSQKPLFVFFFCLVHFSHQVCN